MPAQCVAAAHSHAVIWRPAALARCSTGVQRRRDRGQLQLLLEQVGLGLMLTRGAACQRRDVIQEFSRQNVFAAQDCRYEGAASVLAVERIRSQKLPHVRSVE